VLECDAHARRLDAIEGRLASLQSSSRATLVAAIATPLGAVAVAIVAGWFALQQTREQAAQRGGEAGRQQAIATRVELSSEQLRQAYALGRHDGVPEGRTAALAEVLEAQQPSRRLAAARGKR
jgi:hypothetical protein